jgi:ribosomal protein L34
MTKRLSVAERLAADTRDITLNAVADQSSWDRFLVEQAVLVYGESLTEFSANDLRDVLPEMGRGFLGAAITSLRSAGVIARIEQTVPSTSKRTKGHGLRVWQLTDKGRAIAAQRRAARNEQRKAAA